MAELQQIVKNALLDDVFEWLIVHSLDDEVASGEPAAAILGICPLKSRDATRFKHY